MDATAQQIADAVRHKEAGNVFFKEKNYKKALGQYHRVFLYVKALKDDEEVAKSKSRDQQGSDQNDFSGMASIASSGHQTAIPPEQLDEVRLLKVTTKVNMMTCYLNLCERVREGIESGDAAQLQDWLQTSGSQTAGGAAGSGVVVPGAPMLDVDMPDAHDELSAVLAAARRETERWLARCVEEGKDAVRLLAFFPHLEYDASKAHYKLGKAFLLAGDLGNASEQLQVAGSSGVDVRKELRQVEELRRAEKQQDKARLQAMFGGKLQR
eukprot:g7278.t1